MLQWYICALVDLFYNRIDYTTRVAFLGAVARDGFNTPVPSDYIKKYQQAFLAPLPGTQNLLATLRNVNSTSSCSSETETKKDKAKKDCEVLVKELEPPIPVTNAMVLVEGLSSLARVW